MENKQTEDLEKDIVSFEKAIELCTLGFDKQTLCGYDIADRQLYLCQVDEDGIYMPQKDLAAPTKSQVFRWFDENTSYQGFVTHSIKEGQFDWYIINNDDLNEVNECIEYYPSRQEAENACINKLTELLKINKK